MWGGVVRAGSIGVVALLVVAVVSSAAPRVPINRAPAPPAILSQVDGVTRGRSPVLRAEVADPDGDQLTVTFYGRRSTTAPGTPADSFTVVVVPDPQHYASTRALSRTYVDQMRWVVARRDALDIRFVVSLGDIVQRDEEPEHWVRASRAWRVLERADVPHAVLPGNHDLGDQGEPDAFDRTFPPSRYADEAWYGGWMGDPDDGIPDPEDRGNRNSYQTFTAGGVDMLVLNLEIDMPPPAVAWADAVLDAHPDHQVILATHRWMRRDGVRWRGPLFPDRPATPPDGVWRDLVAEHCNVVLVVAGHDGGEARRVDESACGRPVFQLLSNYQNRRRGGDGWLRYITFDAAASTMEVFTYSTTLGRFEADAGSRFTLPWSGSGAPFSVIARDVGVPSGATASVRWSDLASGAAFEWFAIAGDGALATAGTIRRFRTP